MLIEYINQYITSKNISLGFLFKYFYKELFRTRVIMLVLFINIVNFRNYLSFLEHLFLYHNYYPTLSMSWFKESPLSFFHTYNN